MSSSPTGTTLDVTALFARGMTPFHWRILLISSLVTFFDGLDYSLISFTLPYLRDEMALTDEMTGFVIAVTYVRPNRSLDEVDVRSVTKKMKDKGFARQVPRDQLTKGAEELGVPFEEHVVNVIEGLKTVRRDLGL